MVSNGSGVVATSNVISVAVTCSRIGHAYVTNSSDNTVSQFSIGADGTLTPMAAAESALGSVPSSIAMHPAGNYAYVVNTLSRTVSQVRDWYRRRAHAHGDGQCQHGHVPAVRHRGSVWQVCLS